MKRLLALLLSVTGIASAQQIAGTTTTPMLDPSQVYTTGNIVQQTTTTTGSTWVGAVYQDQLTCWAGGDPGYCGPNAIVRPGNYLNFSYGSTYVYQQQHITNVLPSSTGLQVNGYNFSFTAKNGNGWDDGRVDQLSALVRFWDNTGNKGSNNLLYGNSYSLNYKFNWTDFNYSENFTKPLAVPDVGLVQYGFIGKDNNFWQGPYGPEIMNVSFNVKYSVDPCLKDPLFSSTCPGYTDALLKSLPVAQTTDPLAPTASTTTTPPEAAAPPPPPPAAPPPPPSAGQPTVVASVVSAPSPATTSSPSTTSTSQTTKESTQSSGGNVSLALSIISKNSERDAAGSAVAQSAMTQAQQAANQAQQEAQSVASSAVSTSLTTTTVITNNQQSSGNGIKVNNNAGQISSSSITNNMTLGSSVTGPNSPTIIAPTQQSFDPAMPGTMNQTNYNTPTSSNLVSMGVTQTNETYQLLAPSFLTDRSNPMNDIVEGKQSIPLSSNVTFTGSVVNRSVGDNDVAGGVSINRMAMAPTGYGDYLNFTLKDAAFYQPKEVYRNQRNIDNARLLRQMTSDNKHKEMMEMQYAK